MGQASRLILAGGGGFGREVASWVDHCTAAGAIPPLAGFIDERSDAMKGHDTAWLGGFRDYRVASGDVFLVTVGDPATKAAMVASLRERGGQFARLIHPTAVMGRNPHHGDGIIMAPLSMNTADTRMGDFVTLLSFSGLGHDSQAGNFTTISSHADIMGGAKVGERVLIGSGARVMPGVRVGDDARIGAGVLVQRTVQPGMTMYLPPAKRLRLGGSAQAG